MVYYKPTSLFSSTFLYTYRMLYGMFVYKPMMYYKPTLFRADVWEIAHGLIIHTIRVSIAERYPTGTQDTRPMHCPPIPDNPYLLSFPI